MGVSRDSGHSPDSIFSSIVYSPIWLTMTLMSCHYLPSPVRFASLPPSLLLLKFRRGGGGCYQVASHKVKERCSVRQVVRGNASVCPMAVAI